MFILASNSKFLSKPDTICIGANQNGMSASNNGQERASSGSSGISRLKNEIAKSFRLSSSPSVTSNTAAQSTTNDIQEATECSENSKT